MPHQMKVRNNFSSSLRRLKILYFLIDTIVDARDLLWQEHVVVDKHSDWAGDWESHSGAASSASEVDSNSNFSEKPSTKDTADSHSSPCSSPNSSSGIGSVSNESKLARVPVRITSLFSPTDFTIQLLSMAEEYVKFQEEIQGLAKGQAPLTIFEVDKYCLAYNRLDGAWVRAIIIDVAIEEFLISVKCLDTGSTFSVDDKNNLLYIPVKFIFFTPKFAYRCSLPLRHDLLKEDKISSFLLSRKDSDLSCTFITTFGPNLNFIELYQGDTNVTDLLVINKYVKRQVIVPEGYGCISFVTNQCQFAVRMESHAEMLSSISTYASNYRMIEILKPEVGQLVMFKDYYKNIFHRGEVVSFLGEKIRVYLVDIGKYMLTDKVGAIDNNNISSIPPQAIKCSLLLPSSAQKDKNVTKKFRQLANHGKKRVYFMMVQPGDEAAKVDVFVDLPNNTRQNIVAYLIG